MMMIMSMSSRLPRRLFNIGLASMLGLACCTSSASGGSSYGTKVRFAKDVAVAFADFDLTYLGKRHVASPVYKAGFTYDDFKVSRGDKRFTVSWSSGTGLLGPQPFEFDGKKFELELRHHDKLGWLKDNEVVVSRK